MKEEYRRIMKMVQDGKISAEDAAELIEAFHDAPAEPEPAAAGATQSEPTHEPKSKEDVFAKIISQFDQLTKDVAKNVNWQDLNSQLRTGVSKSAEIIKETIDQASKGRKGWGVFFGQSTAKTVDLPLTIDSSKILMLEGVSGDIFVEGGYENASVHIEAVFRAYSEDEAREIAERYTPILEESDHFVTLKHSETDHLSADVTVRLPFGVAVEIKSVSGSVEIKNTHAGARIQGTSGDLNLTGLTGVVDVNLTSGLIRVSDSKTSMTQIESKSGDIRLTDVDGGITVRSSSGDIRMFRCSGRNISAEAASGDVSLDLILPVAGTVNVRTVSGDVLLEIADGSDCRVNLNTIRGQVSSSLILQDESRDNLSLRGKLGDGSGTLDASVVNGSIHLGLRDSTEAKAEFQD